jgi:threonine dehydrogenase-like Zn-dependent dehydrogenase
MAAHLATQVHCEALPTGHPGIRGAGGDALATVNTEALIQPDPTIFDGDGFLPAHINTDAAVIAILTLENWFYGGHEAQVIVLGCGPVGLLAQRFCWTLGAIRVIAVDYLDYRLEHAAKFNKVETVNFEQHDDTGKYLKEITHGGADIVIDCVGMDGKMTPLEYLASGLKLQGGALGGFVIASQCVRKGGMIQVTGIYGGKYNGVPLGDLLNRNINIRLGQAPVISFLAESSCPRAYFMAWRLISP